MSMNVGELIQELQKFSPDAQVLFSDVNTAPCNDHLVEGVSADCGWCILQNS